MAMGLVRVASGRVTTTCRIVVVAVSVAACGSPAPAPLTAPRELAPDTPLLVLDEYPGGPLWADASSPRLHALYADGTLLSASRIRRSRLPEVVTTTLSDEQVDGLWRRFVDGGLRHDGDLVVPGLFDRPTLVLTSNDGTTRTTLQLDGLSRDGDAAGEVGGPPGDQRAVRAAAAGFLGMVDAAVAGNPWTPDRIAVYLAAGDGMEGPRAEWTGGLELGTAGAPTTAAGFERCLVAEGAEAADIARAAAGVPPVGLAVQDGTPWLVDVRVLYPDEPDPEDCA